MSNQLYNILIILIILCILFYLYQNEVNKMLERIKYRLLYLKIYFLRYMRSYDY